MTSPEGLIIDIRVSTSPGGPRGRILKGLSPGTTKLNTSVLSSPLGRKGAGRGEGSDFSVVLLRSDFVLVSEKNRMKVHKNQWLLAMTYPPERLFGATRRRHTLALRRRTLHSG
jgi:hypothetical protein